MGADPQLDSFRRSVTTGSHMHGKESGDISAGLNGPVQGPLTAVAWTIHVGLPVPRRATLMAHPNSQNSAMMTTLPSIHLNGTTRSLLVVTSL